MKNSTLYQRKHRRSTSGFTLIELMVGMVMGLLVTVVIAQVLVSSEGRRRTTVAGSDAQANGALALYTLQRDIQAAGYGMTSILRGLGCPIRAERGGVSFPFVLQPLAITDGAAGAPDTLLVMSSAKLNFSAPARITADHPPTAANFFVSTTLGIEDGDLMIAVPATLDTVNNPPQNWCSVFQVTGTGQGQGQGQGQGLNQVIHNSGNGGDWNQPGGSTIFPTLGYPNPTKPGYEAGSYVVNLGQFVTRTYSIANQALVQTTFNSAAALSSTDELFPHVVNLQAFYGKDTNGDGVVDTYNNATPTNGAGWDQVRSVRIVVVARSAQMEREPVTAAEPLWNVGTAASVTGATASVACGAGRMCVTLNVNGLADWQRYRYKVYDSVVPVRNLLWRS